MCSYIPHSEEEYKLVLKLRNESGLGSKRIRQTLLEQGYNISIGAINGWIYHNKEPFKKKIIKQIPKTSAKLTLKKAYLLGVFCGDGYISTWNRLGLEVCDKEFADYFQSCLERGYNQKASRSKRIRVKKQHYIVSLASKRIVEDLERYIVFKDKNYKNWRVPEQIKNAPKNIQAAFIRGFADSEGSVRFRKGATEIALYSGNKAALKEIQKILLIVFNIDSNIRLATKTVFGLYISSYKSLKNFYDQISFTIRRKRNNLRKGLTSYKRKGLNKYSKETRRRAVELFRKHKNYREVERITGINRGSVHDWVLKENSEPIFKITAKGIED